MHYTNSNENYHSHPVYCHKLCAGEILFTETLSSAQRLLIFQLLRSYDIVFKLNIALQFISR